MLDSLHQAAPAINELAGKLPIVDIASNDAHVDSDGHLHNALLSTTYTSKAPPTHTAQE